MLEQNLLRQWIKEAKAGDFAAFERIVLLHERLVLRFAQRFLLNREDAKDAAQEVFLRLHRNLNRFEEDRDLLPWLYRMTANICFDIARRSKPALQADGTSDPVDDSLNPEQAFSRKQEHALIAIGLAELSPHERMAIVLRDLEGRSTAEVAQTMGSSESTVRSQISTGRVKLRDFVMNRIRRRA